MFMCHRCSFVACTVHNVAFHHGESCAQYDERMREERILLNSVHAQEAASARVLAWISKPCPGCGINIQKDGGCDHITCKCSGGDGFMLRNAADSLV
jgi:hypothetical protein